MVAAWVFGINDSQLRICGVSARLRASHPAELTSHKAADDTTMNKCNPSLTSEPVQPGWASQVAPEFIRTNDVWKIFGIRRGSFHTLAKLGRVKSWLIRIRGNRLGMQLWNTDSIQALIRDSMGKSDQVTIPATLERQP
jgi:hypothetical protein